MNEETKNNDWPRRFYEKFYIADDEVYDFIEKLLAEQKQKIIQEIAEYSGINDIQTKKIIKLIRNLT